MVRAAIAESRVAIARADKLKKEVQSYGGKVESVNRSLTSSTQQLETAQQEVIAGTIRAKLSEVRATAAGRVLQVATIASEVGAGDVVADIGQSDRLKFYFQDFSDHWKALRKDARLPVIIAAPNISVSASGALPAGETVSARIESIEPPKAPGQPATILALVHNPARGTTGLRAFGAGWEVRSASAAASQLFVAQNALLQQNDVVQVAVLKQAAAPEEYGVEWRTIKLGRQSGEKWEVKGGLQAGERVALQPAQLRNYTLERGVKATVRLVN